MLKYEKRRIDIWVNLKRNAFEQEKRKIHIKINFKRKKRKIHIKMNFKKKRKRIHIWMNFKKNIFEQKKTKIYNLAYPSSIEVHADLLTNLSRSLRY